MSNLVRVFIVDDSRVSREVLTRALLGQPGVSIIGHAVDGRSALARIPGSGADVVLMDVTMPGMDGLEVTRQLMAVSALPIMIVSDLVGRRPQLPFDILDVGALDLARKPTMEQARDPGFRAKFATRVRRLAEIPVITRTSAGARSRAESGLSSGSWSPAGPASMRRQPADASVVCIGASTGGPQIIHRLLRAIPRIPHPPVIVVQHISGGFAAGLAAWLGAACRLPVRLAQDGEQLQQSRVYVAPDEHHTEVDSGVLRLIRPDSSLGYMPSIDRLLLSAARSQFGAKIVAVQLSGMGDDGAAGLKAIRDAGGWTMAQEPGSAVVPSMPKAAINADAACEVLNVDQLASRFGELPGDRR